ncbi:uncharacterized protein [Macrobrachium rosenbergii]|uniref:uncharacterized protein n=1 Tax=Macrobrachium rosenbergii TaxID=79674 RepID=UPI0034D6E91C
MEEEEEEEEDAEEDTHVCLRCQTTIIGLSNYITHRKAGCGNRRRTKLKEHPDTITGRFTGSLKQKVSLEIANTQGNSKEYVGTSPSTQIPDAGPKSAVSNRSEHAREEGSNLRSSSESIQHCYAGETEQPDDEPLHKGQETSVLHGYSMLDGYASPDTQVHKDSPVSSTHLKGKAQGSHTLIRKQNPSQAPFTGYGDPLLPHSQDGVSLFRPFDSFGEPHKIQHEGDAEQHGEPMALFKVSSASYELESQSFESRYPDFYTIQSTPQEPLLNSESSIEHCKPKEQTDTRQSDPIEKKNISGSSERISEDTTGAQASFRDDVLKYDSHMSPDYTNEKSELRQDDFLSSLELRSSIKLPAKRRHEDDEDEFDEDDDDDGTRPPHHHTGGKWRPGSRPPPSVGGKWRPATPRADLDDEPDEMEEEEETFAPLPPTYTKGKWLPGKKISNIVKVGSVVEYHCNACNRTLMGKENYERHLKSELHVVNESRVSGKKDAEAFHETSVTESSKPVRSKKLKAQSFLRSTIARLKSRKVISDEKDSHNDDKAGNSQLIKSEGNSLVKSKRSELGNALANVQKESSQEFSVDEEEESVKKASAATSKLLCPICKLSFGVAYVSLHFASLAHIHNELEYRQNRCTEIDSVYRKLVLRNFGAIIKSSPFCCLDCKFYCNTNEDLLNHARTHKEDIGLDEMKILYSCSACSDEDSLTLSDLIHHIQTPYHADNSLDQVLQSKQIAVQSRVAIVCPFGDGTFQYRRQYLTHRRIHHNDVEFQLKDQRFLHCPQCTQKFLREREMRIHIKEVHKPSKKEVQYHCFVCGLAFPTQRQAKLHRRSAEHRTTLGRQRGISVARTCNLCYEETEDLTTLRQHMAKEHQKDCTPCHLCGVVLPHRSDLAQHQRVCSREPDGLLGIHSCELCSFKNDLLAHVLMHFTLAHGQQEGDGRFPCHICKTKLRVSSVKGHMLSHSNEWPHACHLCSRKFPLALWLERHLAIVHTHSSKQPRDTQSLCDLCGKTLSNRCHLHRHKQEVKCHAPVLPQDQIDDEVTENVCFSGVGSSAKVLDGGTLYLSGTDHHSNPCIEVTHTALGAQTVTNLDNATDDSCRSITYASIIPSDGLTTSTNIISGGDSTCLLAPHRGCKGHKTAEKVQPKRHHAQQCDVCGVRCESLSALKAHRQEHKRRDGSHYQCPHCGYGTTHLPHLRRHLRLHTGSMPFCCPYCSYVCNNQENLRKHMLKTKKHPGRFMYECRLCLERESLSQSAPMPSESPHHMPSTSSEPIDYSGAHTLDLETGNLAEPIQQSQDGKNQSISEGEVFKSNYATELHTHLLEKHPKCFETKDEITTHIRSYYRAEQDHTVTSSPLPFTHKKRQKTTSTYIQHQTGKPERPRGGNSGWGGGALVSDHQLRRGSSRRRSPDADRAVPRHGRGLQRENFYSSSFHGRLLLRAGRGGGAPQSSRRRRRRRRKRGKELETQDVIRPESFHGAGMDGHAIQPDETAVSKDLSVVPGPSCGTDLKVIRGPRSYLRTASRPSILRTNQHHPSPQQHQPLRILIQHLPDVGPPEGEEEGTRQVILILPEKVGGQPGDVAALLPSLGLASSPADCVSIVTVQPKDDHTQQQLRILSEDHQPLTAATDAHVQQMPKHHVGHPHPEGTVIMPGDQVMTLETQMVADAEVAAVAGEPVLHHHGHHHHPHHHHQHHTHHHHHHHASSVVLCAQPHDQEHVFNPLQVVAEAAEALTQNEIMTHQVIDASPHGAPEVLAAQGSVVQQTSLLQEAMFNHPVGIQAATAAAAAAVQSADAAGILHHEASVEYVDEHVIASSDQVASQDAAEGEQIIYSLSL